MISWSVLRKTTPKSPIIHHAVPKVGNDKYIPVSAARTVDGKPGLRYVFSRCGWLLCPVFALGVLARTGASGRSQREVN